MTGKDGGTRIANFTYDALNRVSQITRPGIGTLATYSYNAVGNRIQTQRANGIVSTYGYDDLHRLTGIEHKKGTEVLSQFAYTLNNDGKRGTLTEYVKYPEGQTVASINRTVHYGYDNAGRLIGEQRLSHQTLAAGGTVDKTAHTVWTYDKANNRTTQHLSNYDGLGTDTPSVLTSTHATQYNYNSSDWLQNQTSEYTTSSTSNTYTTNYEYNGNGSQSAVTTNVGTSDQKRTPYFYDFEEKLIGIGNPADTTKHAYAYDADGNRVTETNYNSGTPTTKHYLVDPNVSHAQVVEEFDSANQLLAHHDWDDAELLRSAVADSEGNAHITQPLADGHNSTRQLMDATGSIGGVLGYDAWGNAQESIGLSTAYRYNGQRLDASGLYHLRARQYAPWTGRFLSHDPIFGDMNNPITQHRYLYAGNDAVNLVDPSGESFDMAGLGSTMAIGAALGGLGGGVAHYAVTGEWSWGAVIQGAAIGAVLAPVSVAFPAVGVGLGVVGVGSSAYIVQQVLLDPTATVGQKIAAVTLLAVSAYGTRQAWNAARNQNQKVALAALEEEVSVVGSNVKLGQGPLSHFTDADGVLGIAGVDGESMSVGQTVVVKALNFGRGKNQFMADKSGDIFVTELPPNASPGQLNQIGVMGPKQSFVIQFSRESAMENGIMVNPSRPERSIYTIPGERALGGKGFDFTVTRLK